jgi:1,4-alpha-glucan branching enzyme
VSAIGAFTFVLHSHLPYARLAGRWPHGEEWIHEAATETYLPLLKTLLELKAEGVPFHLTLGITPTLAEQLADSLVLDNLNRYLDLKIAAAERDVLTFADNEHMRFLAEWYVGQFKAIKSTFNDDFGGVIIPHFRRLMEGGDIEIVASVATHAYLPLLAQDSTIYAQIRTGIAALPNTTKKAICARVWRRSSRNRGSSCFSPRRTRSRGAAR